MILNARSLDALGRLAALAVSSVRAAPVAVRDCRRLLLQLLGVVRYWWWRAVYTYSRRRRRGRPIAASADLCRGQDPGVHCRRPAHSSASVVVQR